MTDQNTPETPTHCAGCERPLFLRRPGRTHCEPCRPTMLDSTAALYRSMDERPAVTR